MTYVTIFEDDPEIMDFSMIVSPKRKTYPRCTPCKFKETIMLLSPGQDEGFMVTISTRQNE